MQVLVSQRCEVACGMCVCVDPERRLLQYILSSVHIVLLTYLYFSTIVCFWEYQYNLHWSYWQIDLCLCIFTDNQELKAMIQDRLLFNVRTTNSTPAHFSNSYHFSDEIFVEATSDMGILAGALCLVSDLTGGFSLQARLWGGQSLWDSNACFYDLHKCIEEGNEIQQALDIIAHNHHKESDLSQA